MMQSNITWFFGSSAKPKRPKISDDRDSSISDSSDDYDSQKEYEMGDSDSDHAEAAVTQSIASSLRRNFSDDGDRICTSECCRSELAEPYHPQLAF